MENIFSALDASDGWRMTMRWRWSGIAIISPAWLLRMYDVGDTWLIRASCHTLQVGMCLGRRRTGDGRLHWMGGG